MLKYCENARSIGPYGSHNQRLGTRTACRRAGRPSEHLLRPPHTQMEFRSTRKDRILVLELVKLYIHRTIHCDQKQRKLRPSSKLFPSDFVWTEINASNNVKNNSWCLLQKIVFFRIYTVQCSLLSGVELENQIKNFKVTEVIVLR